MFSLFFNRFLKKSQVENISWRSGIETNFLLYEADHITYSPSY